MNFPTRRHFLLVTRVLLATAIAPLSAGAQAAEAGPKALYPGITPVCAPQSLKNLSPQVAKHEGSSNPNDAENFVNTKAGT